MDIRARCDFDKSKRAAWFCSHCNAHYSERCIPDGHNPLWGRRGPVCLLCFSELTATDDPALAKPFWHVLPYLLLYPFHPNGLLLILTAVCGVLMLGGGTPAVIFAVMFQVVCVKYYFAVLAARAEGKRWPPSLLSLIKSDRDQLLLKAVLVYVVQAALLLGLLFYYPDNYLPLRYQPFILYGLLALMLFAFPAITMILAREKSLLRAISPFAIGAVIAGMGVYYLLLWVLLIMLGLAIDTALQFAVPLLDEPWQLTATLGITTYSSLLSYGLLGYALFQFRAEIGLEPDERPVLSETEFVRAQGLGAVFVLQQHGELERACEQMRELANKYRDEPAVQRQYHQLLLQLGSPDARRALSAHSDFFIEFLLAKNNKQEAAQVLLATLDKVPTFRPSKLGTTLTLWPQLNKHLTPRQRAALLLNAHKHYRDDAGIAVAYRYLAELFEGPLAQPDKARQLRAFIQREYQRA
ncbi:hypothetical protein [Gilvimarinus agarilyticus]|uniref:hypothetical protein n=1 Tax=Gilvimarinus agarilyticus TaxID=679259 RepID=UPI00059FD779|nr:hypothetical protein [Gilvimarinus agarilyticus]